MEEKTNLPTTENTYVKGGPAAAPRDQVGETLTSGQSGRIEDDASSTPTAIDLAKMEAETASWRLKKLQKQALADEMAGLLSDDDKTRGIVLELGGWPLTLTASTRFIEERVQVDASSLLPHIIAALRLGAARAGDEARHIDRCVAGWKAGEIEPFQDHPGLWTVVPE